MIDDRTPRGGPAGAIFAPARHRVIDATYAQALIAAQAQLLKDCNRDEMAREGVSDNVDVMAVPKSFETEL